MLINYKISKHKIKILKKIVMIKKIHKQIKIMNIYMKLKMIYNNRMISNILNFYKNKQKN